MKFVISDRPQNGKEVTIVDTTINFCKLDKGWMFSGILKYAFDSFKKFSNMKLRCPIKKVG
jgi:hypothetical protein